MPHVPLKVLLFSFRDSQLHRWNQGLEDDEETSEVPVTACSSQSSTIIYCFLSGTHSYIDGTKDWKTMKKHLRFQLPHVPLKVRRREEDQEDVMDKYYERFKAPTSTSEHYNDDSTDGYSTSSSLPRDYTGEMSEEGMARYLGSSIESIDNDSQREARNLEDDQVNNTGYQTTGSVSHEAIEMQVLAQVHRPPTTDSSDDDTPGRDFGINTGYQTTGSVSEEPVELQALAEVHQPPNFDTDNTDIDALSTEATINTGNVSWEGMERYRDGQTSSIESFNQSDSVSQKEARHLDNDDIDDNMGYQTTGSITHEATELQAMAQVHQPPDTDNIDEEEAAGNVRHEGLERSLGRDTDSSAAQPDTASLDSNVRHEGLERYLGRDTDSIGSAAQPDTDSGFGEVEGNVLNPTDTKVMFLERYLGRDTDSRFLRGCSVLLNPTLTH